MKYLIVPALLFFFISNFLYSQDVEEVIDSTTIICGECDLPESIQNSYYFKKNKVADLILKDNQILYNVKSVKRVLYSKYGNDEEGIKVFYTFNGECLDTIFDIENVQAIRVSDIGGGGQPVQLEILPSRFYYRDVELTGIPSSFLEITGVAQYAGSYDNPQEREVGFAPLAYNAEILLNPFGGDKLRFAFLASAMFENDRIRAPLGVHLRYKLFGDQREVVTKDNFYPSACTFADGDKKALSPNDNLKPGEDKFEHVTLNMTEFDSTVYYTHDTRVETDFWRPFLFIEGGIIQDIVNDPAGLDKVINDEDYGQYFIGAGIGAPLWSSWTASLGYRYKRLNTKTPCITCDDLYILNTNNAHSFFLKFGYRLNW